jgi:HlyD family secretion protein
VTATVLLGLAALVALALRPSPVPVELATVTRGSMRVTLDEDGETRVRDRYVVSAPLAGRVLRIVLEPGDPVVANRTVLATFLPMAPALLDVRTRAEIQARIAAAEAALKGARAAEDRAAAQLAQAERERQRSRELAKAGALAPEQLEGAELSVQTLRTGLESARAGVRTGEAELRLARASLIGPAGGDRSGTAIQLRAPVNGIVLRRVHESEAIVQQGEPLVEVGDVSKLEIVADYLSTDAVRIRARQPALVERWGGGETIRGTVRRVEPSGFTKVSALGVEEQRVNVILDFESPRDAFTRLGDRFRVEVRVIVWEEPDVTKVPVSALVRDGDRWAVFMVEEARARRVPVRIGQRNDTEAQILEGLSPGARVIAFPSESVADGVAVEATNQGPRS